MSATNTLVATLLTMAGQRNVITVPRAFVSFTESFEAAMMLNQLLFWMPRAHGESVYKTDADWKDELCLTRYAVRKARERLVEMGFLRTETHHVGGAPAVHYYLDYDALTEQWSLWLHGQEVKSENEQYIPPSKVRKRTLPHESSSNSNEVKFENGQTMNHRVPTVENHDDDGDRARARKVLRDAGIYNGSIRQILALNIDPATLIASVQALAADGWGPGSIADELRDNPPPKGQPYERRTERPIQSDYEKDRPKRSAVAPRGKHAPTGGADVHDPGWQEREIARIHAEYGITDDD